MGWYIEKTFVVPFFASKACSEMSLTIFIHKMWPQQRQDYSSLIAFFAGIVIGLA